MRNFINFLKHFALFALTLGAAILYLYFGKQTVSFELNATRYVLLGLCIVCGFFLTRFLHTLLHELGHLIFGIAQGFEFYSFRAGRFYLRRDSQRKIKLGFGKKSQYAGNLLMICKNTDRLEKRYLTLALGGSIGSLFALIVFSCLPIFHTVVNPYVYYLCGIGFPISVYLFLLNTIPFYRLGAYTDGALVSEILHKDPSVQYALRTTAIQSMLFQGTAPSELPQDCFDGLPIVADNDVNKLQFMIYAYARALDSDDLETADRAIRFLEDNLEDLPDLFRDSVQTDIFFHVMTYRRQPDRAQALYDSLKSYIDADPNICNLRIRATYELYILNDPARAIATTETALRLKKDFILPGIARMEEKLLNRIALEAESIETTQRH